MNQLISKKTQFVGTGLTNNRLEKTNTRLLMQALHGCRKNCSECRQAEAEWETKIEQKEAKRA